MGWTTATSQDFVSKLLDFITNNEIIDEKRIYLTGHSMGGLGTWYLGAKLKNKLAAIVPLSSVPHEKIETEIEKGSFDNLPIWNFIHRAEAKESRNYFTKLADMGYAPVYTHRFGDSNYDLTHEEIMQQVNAGKKYFYTEYNYRPCVTADCHYAMHKALKEPFLFEWLFKQKRD